MNEEELAIKLAAIVKTRQRWDEDFGGLTVRREKAFTELEYRDSGVGEDYVRRAFEEEWPDRSFDVDTQGGCDSCGYGRTISITISGAQPPWEAA